MPEEKAHIVFKFAKFLRHKTRSVSSGKAGTSTEDEWSWEPSFFERTVGCLADKPIACYPQPPYDLRESLA